MMVHDPVDEFYRVAVFHLTGQAGQASATFFIGHTDSPVERRIGVAVAGIKKVKYFFGKIYPAIFIEIFSMILSDQCLKFTLPRRNDVMVRLRGGWKVIRVIDKLFVIINMHMGHPGIV